MRALPISRRIGNAINTGARTLAAVAPIPWPRKMERAPRSALRSSATRVSSTMQVRVCCEVCNLVEKLKRCTKLNISPATRTNTSRDRATAIRSAVQTAMRFPAKKSDKESKQLADPVAAAGVSRLGEFEADGCKDEGECGFRPHDIPA